MIIKITHNISLSFPIKYVNNHGKNEYVLESAGKSVEMIQPGQEAQIVSYDNTQYRLLDKSLVRSIVIKKDDAVVDLETRSRD